MNDTVRIDKWLWSVRLFKTRSLAIAACRAGHVRVNGHPVKASRDIRSGDLLVVRTGHLLRTVRVLLPIENRVGAARVPECLEDLTPAEELARARESMPGGPMWRPPGSGRPTKRDRRRMESWLTAAPDSEAGPDPSSTSGS